MNQCPIIVLFDVCYLGINTMMRCPPRHQFPTTRTIQEDTGGTNPDGSTKDEGLLNTDECAMVEQAYLIIGVGALTHNSS